MSESNVITNMTAAGIDANFRKACNSNRVVPTYVIIEGHIGRERISSRGWPEVSRGERDFASYAAAQAWAREN